MFQLYVVLLVLGFTQNALSKPAAYDATLVETAARLEQLHQDNSLLRNQVMGYRRRMEDLKKHDSITGFLAQPRNDMLYDPNDLVLYDFVLFNPGNHYDPTTSTYTCPVSGYYYFAVAVLNQDRLGDDLMQGSIYINGVPQIRATADADNEVRQGNAGGIMRCNQGDMVNIRVECSGCLEDFSLLASNESSFTGFLISSDS